MPNKGFKNLIFLFLFLPSAPFHIQSSVDLEYDESSDTIQQTHNIVSGATKSDCKTCFDSMEVKSFPVARYAPGQLHKTRLGSIGMVNGPTLLRSGAMATELALSYGDGRIRVMVQHAPVWEAGVEPGSGPPQALKLLRAMVSREALRPAPPTPETEAENPPPQDNPAFFRPVPPFAWHKEWGGTSWTWGPTSGNRGWAIEKMEEVDAWHGRPTGDSTNVWNLRLPGGVLLQVPRVIVHGEAGICRVAWLPQDDTLLRLEAGVLALEPMTMEDDTMVGFYPPSLGSLRCDVMKKIGELENVSMLVRDDERDELKPLTEEELRSNDNSGLGEVRDAMGP